MSAMPDSTRAFDAVVTVGATGRVMVPLPFSPDEAWGTKRNLFRRRVIFGESG
jgi:rRNA maturation protein Nop10